MTKRNATDNDRNPEVVEETEVEQTPHAVEPETHPAITADTPHVDPTGVADFDRPYDQWSNDDLKIRAKQLGVQGAFGHGELIDAIHEAERKLEEREAEAATVEAS